MSNLINLTDFPNPMAQTFRVTEPTGIVITAASLYFYSAPGVSDTQLPIILELRPVVNGAPSSTNYIPGTRVTKTAAQVRTVLSAATGSGLVWDETGTLPEVKFSFDHPVYIPGNTEVALVAYTNATAGQYKVWAAKLGEYKWVAGSKSTAARVSSQPAVGSFFQSSNGTTWTPLQDVDVAFNVYRAEFTYENTYAVFKSVPPPLKNLSETNAYSNPLIFTAGSNKVRVIHPEHGYLPGDVVTLSTDSNASSTFDDNSVVGYIGGVFGSSILGDRQIDSVDPYGYVITIDSDADSSIRAGGNGLLATEQYKFSSFNLKLPRLTPAGTQTYTSADLTTFASYADQDGTLISKNPYQATTGIAVIPGTVNLLKLPHVLTDSNQTASELSSSPAATFTTTMITADKRIAPAILAERVNLRVVTNLIDYFDSDNATATVGRHYSSVLNYAPETSAKGGIAVAKHITIPYSLATGTTATSIKVLLDGYRPLYTDFSVWYRACLKDDKDIYTVDWIEFSKTPSPPDVSNYNDISRGEAYNEYEFSVFDIVSFDTYQIKVVFNTTNDAYVPMIRNLRTIATE